MDIEKNNKFGITKTVLIVEDNPVKVLNLLTWLENKGLNLLFAPNGETALKLAKLYLPDLILLDGNMPVMGGLEACRHLKDDPHTASIQIVLITAHGEQQVLEGCLAGASLVVEKNAHLDETLADTLQRLLFKPEE